MSPTRSGRLRALVATATIALLPHAGLAGPADPVRHAFERVGPAGAAPVLTLHVPETSRLLVLQADGGVEVRAGDGLLRESWGALPVDDACGAAVLGATWSPDAPGTVLFASYVAADTRAVTVARVELQHATRTFEVAPLLDAGSPATCQRLGGGLAFAADGTLLFGIGDHGAPAAASSPGTRVGKILRLTPDGDLPGAPLEANPYSPTSPVYALGVRDPVALAADPATGDVWFLDRGPVTGADELNLVQPMTDHGWNGLMATGPLGLPGDPYHSWSPPAGVDGLASARTALGGTLGGGLLVTSSTDGRITVVHPDLGDPLGSSEETLFTREPTGPQAFPDVRTADDGALHALADDGGLWRLRMRLGVPLEPSRDASVLPATLAKEEEGGFTLSAERVPGSPGFGVHVGDLMTLAAEGYSHADAPDAVLPTPPATGRAVAEWRLTEQDLGGPGRSVYVLVGALDGCVATGLGADSFAVGRPGGLGTASGPVAVLGGGTHDMAAVIVTEIASSADRLNVPRDLEFHPDVPGELWIVNRQDDSAVIVFDAGGPAQTSSYRWGPGGNHFLAQPSAIAFGPGTRYFATAHEEDELTQGPPPAGTPEDFMGPTLWTNDSSIFEGGHASHYDMLHNSPNGAGIAWESGSAYWVFDGWHDSLTRYDFGDDHGLGGADHSDGVIDRYVEGLVSYVPDVPSHLAYDHDTDELLVADTGNDRIAVLDVSTAVADRPIGPNYDGCTMRGMSGSTLTTLIDGREHGLVAPSGLELHDCRIFVTDNTTSVIYAFSRDGQLIDWLDTGWPAGSLMGMAFDPRDGDLYVVDAVGDRVVRISPR